MRRWDWWLGLVVALLVANLVLLGLVYREVHRLAAPPTLTLQEKPGAAIPRVVHQVQPEYPAEARERGWQGSVVVQITVDSGGAVREARVLRSSGYGILDSAAVQAARAWRFEPLQGQDQAVMLVPFRFQLAEE